MSPLPPPISLPTPPLLPAPERTNTLALLLPHPFLFHPPILALLRSHYETFGTIHTWAPIRAFGRVIVVFDDEEGAMRAKREGDRLEIGGEEEEEGKEGHRLPEGTYFPRPTEGGGNHPKLTLRLYLAAPTVLEPSSTDHLEPPPITKNFLISPPGSPPEGWEAILEDPPNSNTLAADLTRALEALAFLAPARRGEKTTLIEDGGGPSVTVQDMTPDLHFDDDDAPFIPDEIFESAEGHQQAVRISQVKATVESMAGGGGGGGAGESTSSMFGGYADAFVVGGGKIVPTAMPPRS
ncbi:Calcipressin-domain-containing protein [Mrakia frigida]|uniref:Calcipressin-domain-containing protein n=1 Tax=Mrakia frigida TaxID=29902 RepID=UPI003FCBF802